MMKPLEQEKLLNSLDSIANSLSRIADALASNSCNTNVKWQNSVLDSELPDCKDIQKALENPFVQPHKRQKS